MCKKTTNLFKLIFSTFFLVLNLHASDYDFTLPEDAFDHFAPVGLTKAMVKLAIEYPKTTAVVVGTAIGAVCLVSKESSLRKQECASFSSSRPGLIAVPFQHGFQPYFLGSLCGSAVGVVAKSANLKDQARSLKCEAEAVKIKIDSNNLQLQKLAGGGSELKTSAQKAVGQSSHVKDGVTSLGAKIVALSSKQLLTKDGIARFGTGLDGLESNIYTAKTNSSKLQQSVDELYRRLKSKHDVISRAGTGDGLD